MFFFIVLALGVSHIPAMLEMSRDEICHVITADTLIQIIGHDIWTAKKGQGTERDSARIAIEGAGGFNSTELCA